MIDRRALLVTDVVDSTRLSQRIGDAEMARLWVAHDRAARDLLPCWHGREIDKTDGMLLLFDAASDAVGYAIAYQQALNQISPLLKARAGVHVGPVTLRENNQADVALGAKPLEVEGVAKATAARVMSVSVGGQILLSADARQSLSVEGIRLQSHGHWRLKGLDEPIELFEVGDTNAPFAPPPDAAKAYRVVRDGGQWRTLHELPHSLPAERDAFVGRDESLRQLSRLIDEGGRLVTVLGIGGIGKTRLALRHATGWLGDFPGGAWFCDLSAARSADGIVHAVAKGLEVPLGKADPVRQIGAAICGRGRCLVILDNFEQVAEHAEATLGAWLDAAPQASFVATSRERLGIAGEQVLVLDPLSRAEAEALFLERARASGQREAFAGDEAADVAKLVELLDCLPLAIELAAARARLMPPSALLRRMAERFELLAGSSRRRDRQATLRAALDWSWDLLNPIEQSALVQLAVFESGFTLDAAQAMLELPAGRHALDVVQSLLEKSLLRARRGSRLDMLSTVQQYALEQGRGRMPQIVESAMKRHWLHFAGLSDGQATAEHCIEADNIVAACRRAAAARDDDAALDLLGRTWAALRLTGPFVAAVSLAQSVLALPALASPLCARAETVAGSAWLLLGHIDQARAVLNAALNRLDDEDRWRAEVLCVLGELESMAGDAQHAGQLLDQALALAERCDSPSLRGRTLNALGALASEASRWSDARARYEAALALARSAGDARREGLVLGNLGVLHHQLGERDAAAAAYARAVQLALGAGDRRGEGDHRCNLGLLHLEQGRVAEARNELMLASAIAVGIGHARLQGITQCNLGLALEAEALGDEALSAFEAALASAAGDPRAEGQYRVYVGRMLSRLGRASAARDCLGRAAALLDEGGDLSARCLLHCAQAELAARDGDAIAAAAALDRAEQLLHQLAADDDSEPGREVGKVRLAVQAMAPPALGLNRG